MAALSPPRNYKMPKKATDHYHAVYGSNKGDWKMQQNDRSIIENSTDYILDKLSKIEQRPEGYGIIISEYALAKGVNVSTAGRHLNGMVDSGKMKREQYKIGSRPTWVYTFIE